MLLSHWQVSPLFWRWLKAAWVRYGRRHDLAGISLQHQHMRAASGPEPDQIEGSFLSVNNGNLPYMYKVPGSWGFSPNRRVWPNFLAWQAERAARGQLPDDLQFKGTDTLTTKWWKAFVAEGRDPKMWTQWYMRYMEDQVLYACV